MDCQMPVMDGCEATARIRALQGAGGTRTPIVVMTASVMRGLAARLLAYRLVGLRRSSSANQLWTTCRRVIGGGRTISLLRRWNKNRRPSGWRS
jgi:CheY-like chemotaxis protein